MVAARLAGVVGARADLCPSAAGVSPPDEERPPLHRHCGSSGTALRHAGLPAGDAFPGRTRRWGDWPTPRREARGDTAPPKAEEDDGSGHVSGRAETAEGRGSLP